MADKKSDKNRLVNSLALGWQKEHLMKFDKEITHFNSDMGPVWIIQRKEGKGSLNHFGLLDDSNYAWYREQIGSLTGFFRAYQLKQVSINFYGSNAVVEKAALVGLGTRREVHPVLRQFHPAPGRRRRPRVRRTPETGCYHPPDGRLRAARVDPHFDRHRCGKRTLPGGIEACVGWRVSSSE